MVALFPQELASHSGSHALVVFKLSHHSAVIVVHRYRNSCFILISQYHHQIFSMLCQWLRVTLVLSNMTFSELLVQCVYVTEFISLPLLLLPLPSPYLSPAEGDRHENARHGFHTLISFSAFRLSVSSPCNSAGSHQKCQACFFPAAVTASLS